MARRSPPLLVCVFAACLLDSSCHYYAKPGDPLESDCRTGCADNHERCVASGEAAKVGLPGVTYHRCARDLEACRENCARAKRARLPEETLGPQDTPPTTPPSPAEGVIWDTAARRLRCSRTSSSLSLPSAPPSTVSRHGPDELLVDLAPDAILLMRAQHGSVTEVIETWARLQAHLSGASQLDVDLGGAQTSSGNGVERWDVGYVVDGTRFRAAMRVVQRRGASCTVVAIEREGVSPGRSVIEALDSFGPTASAPAP